jgi:hypothetical protein
MLKIVVYRGFKTDIKLLDHLVGQHEGKVVDLLENSECNIRYLHAPMSKTI